MPTNFPSFRHLRVQKCRHTKSAIKSSYSNILFCFLGNVAECSNRGRWPAPLVAQFGWVSGGPGCLGPCSQLLPGWLASTLAGSTVHCLWSSVAVTSCGASLPSAGMGVQKSPGCVVSGHWYIWGLQLVRLSWFHLSASGHCCSFSPSLYICDKDTGILTLIYLYILTHI